MLRGADLQKVTGSLQASLVGFGSASPAVALCHLKASVRLVCHFPKKIEFGTKVCLFSVVSPSLQPAEGSVWPAPCPLPDSPPSEGGILALTSPNCDASEDESLTLITSGNTQSTVCTLDVAADN